MSDLSPVKRFGPSSGVVAGVVGLVACAGIAAIALTGEVTEGSVQVALGAAVVAVLLWAFMLRPRIVLDEAGSTVLLRNSFVDWRIPLAAVKVVGVRTVTTVKTEDGGRYDCAAVGYPLRRIVRGQTGNEPRPGALPSRRPTDQPPQEIMADLVLVAAERARELGRPAGPAQRLPAWPEIAALVIAVAAFVAGLIV